ncbi:AGAP008101-PA-like protein [Anopheles sinensis]|uniref:AGAP008101-PA-like protein n=1 Tax=Anopheles sinensis TaxID=74873 RepID=A0A084WGX0_ANOSI|nr:AGAP008101-PA-like protein [Anopheles sinensis]
MERQHKTCACPADNDDEGIERDSEEAEEDLATVDGDDCGLRTSLDVVSVSANGCGGERKHLETKELDHVLELLLSARGGGLLGHQLGTPFGP